VIIFEKSGATSKQEPSSFNIIKRLLDFEGLRQLQIDHAQLKTKEKINSHTLLQKDLILQEK
jgi:hypothetical protein